MNRIEVDRSCLPVVLVTMEGVVADDVYADYLKQMSSMMAAKLSRVAIIDGRRSEMNSPKHGRMQANWLRKEQHSLASLDFCTALVIDRPVVRFSLSAMLSIAPIAGTYKVVGDFGEAASWAIERLIALRLSVPQRLRQLTAEANKTHEGDSA